MRVTHTSLEETVRIEGVEHEASISLIVSRNEPGEGTRLHRHPYDETWIVQRGSVTFQADESTRRTGPGDVITVAAGTPHKFTNDGPGRCELICIHPSPSIVEEHLE